MANKVIVLVVPQEDKEQGEVNVLDSREEAERLIEGLLENSKLQRDQIKVFNCHEISFNVTYRPTVALGEEFEDPTHVTVPGSGTIWGDANSQPTNSQNQWGSDYNR